MKILAAIWLLTVTGCAARKPAAAQAGDRFFTSCVNVSVDAATKASTFRCQARDGKAYKVQVRPE